MRWAQIDGAGRGAALVSQDGAQIGQFGAASAQAGRLMTVRRSTRTLRDHIRSDGGLEVSRLGNPPGTPQIRAMPTIGGPARPPGIGPTERWMTAPHGPSLCAGRRFIRWLRAGSPRRDHGIDIAEEADQCGRQERRADQRQDLRLRPSGPAGDSAGDRVSGGPWSSRSGPPGPSPQSSISASEALLPDIA